MLFHAIKKAPTTKGQTGNVLDSPEGLCSPMKCLTSGFEMGPGVTTSPLSPDLEGLVPSKLNNTSMYGINVLLQYYLYDKILDLLVSVNLTYHYAYISDLSTS